MMQQHHGIADGRAFFELIQALCGFYDQAENGSLPAVIVPVPKLPEMDVAEPNRWRRFRYGLAGALMHTWNIIRYTLRPPDQLVCNQPGDFRGNNRVHHHYVDSDLLQSIRAVGKQSGFSTNDLLTGALAVSLAQWSDEYGFPVNFFNVLIPIDMRPRPWTLQSFANHLSSFLVDVNLRRMPTVMDIVAAIRRQVQRQATRLAPRKKVISEIAVARTTTLEQVHKAVYRPQRTMLNFPFSNLIPISPAQHGGRYVTRNWQGEGLRVMTPCAWLQAVNTTVIRYAGQLCFNFNYKESIVSQEMVKRLTELYQASLVKVVEDAVAGGRV
jgi:NRPS condensation-like uncharacterized protein